MSLFKSLKELPREEYFAPGHRMCPGCMPALAARLILKAARGNVVVVNPTGCLEVSTSTYPDTAWRVPWVHIAFENGGSVASGIEAGLKALRKKGKTDEKPHVIVLAGDGGTADIGFQALSGMLERGHDIVYVCYDNEAYMNTGIQRSGTTPFGAATTTTPPGRVSFGKPTWKKDMVAIAVAHGIPYAATACPSYPLDLANKVVKAMEVEGPAYLHVLTPCTPGWRIADSMGVEVGRLAVLTGLWPLYEVVRGQYKLTVQVPRRKPVTEYLKLQGRFKHLTEKEIAEVQRYADELAAKFGLGPRG